MDSHAADISGALSGGNDSIDVDIAVIGAGLAGIAFARFYLDTHENCRLLILEQDPVIGGVWSSIRVFDAFWAQSPLRQTSFSDVPLHLSADDPSHFDTFGAKHVTRYLEHYIDDHLYAGSSLRSRIRLNAQVRSVAKLDDGRWKLIAAVTAATAATAAATAASPPAAAAATTAVHVSCTKLIVASGITSLPVIPAYLAVKNCPIRAIHHRDFGASASHILDSGSIYKYITVIGGGKSAADMTYAAVKAGKTVNWLIRRNGGEGPGIFLDPSADYPYRNVIEAGNTRAAAVLNPSAFCSASWYAQQYYQSEKGQAILMEKLLAVDQTCKANAGYRDRPGALSCFADLEPTASFFWGSGPVGVMQQADFWEVIGPSVNVFRGDPSSVEQGAINLSDGRAIRTDIALCGTGWSASCPFLTAQQVRDFGLPHLPGPDERQEDEKLWTRLMHEADEAIIREYPILKRSVEISQRSLLTPLLPGRLYRGIAPLTDDSVLFLGRTRLANNFRGSEAQAIWATAYLDGHVKVPSPEARRRDVAYHNMFSRRRYPSRGGDGLNLHADLIWYTDALVHEAGLSSHRKDWWHDWNAPCLASDMRDCKDEYLEKYSARLGTDKVAETNGMINGKR